MEDLTGKQFGPYQIVAPLGEGGMAAVYKAYQPAVERYVALKVLPRHFAEDAQFVARFQREAKLLAQLQHPHILPVFDFGQADGYTYIVMPFVESGTLTETLKGQPLPLLRIRQVILQIGDALNYAHARGLIHRDIKPSNILMDAGGNCLLTDFGLARMVEASVNLTNSGTIMGTPAYMSPEQGSGQKIDARSDLYSLGVVLFEMATGRVPYRAETPIAVIFKHIQDPLPPAHELNPELPEAVELVILKALAKSPEDRYQTAGEMVRAIQLAISDTVTSPSLMASSPRVSSPSIAVPPTSQPSTTPTNSRRKLSLPSLTVLVIGLIIILFISLLAFGKGALLTGLVMWGTTSDTAVPSSLPQATEAQPTSASATATLPAPTEPTANPFSCRVVSDDFSQTSSWGDENLDWGSWHHENGEYRTTLYRPYSLSKRCAFCDNYSQTDFQISVTTRTPHPAGSWGIYFWGQGENQYAFELDQGGNAAIKQYAGFDSLLLGSQPIDLLTTHRLTLQYLDGNLSAYIHDEEVLNISVASPPVTGLYDVGLIQVSLASSSAEVFYDDFSFLGCP